MSGSADADAPRRPRRRPARSDARAAVDQLARAVRSRPTTVAAVAAVFVLATLVLLVVRDATYEASAEVLVDLSSGNPVDPAGGAPADPARELQNELRFARSDVLHEAAAQRIDAHHVEVAVTAADDTDLLTFTARADTAETAAAAADATAETYLDARHRVRAERFAQATASFTQRLAELDARIAELGEGAEAERDAINAQRVQLQQQLDALALGAQLLQTARGQVVESATVPSSPVSPRPARDLALALLAGLVVGCGAAVVHEALDERRGGRRVAPPAAAPVDAPAPVDAHRNGDGDGPARPRPAPTPGPAHAARDDAPWAPTPAPARPRAVEPPPPPPPPPPAVPRLAVVPRAGVDVPDPAVASITAPGSPVAAAFRTLRAGLTTEVLDRGQRSVQVTSVVAGEGRTTTVVNLAVELARAGHLVVVVDADLRAPTLHERFRVRNRAGLSSVLAGEAVLADVVRPVHGDDFELFFVPAGPPPPDPSALLADPALEQVLGLLRDDADVVLVDSAPLLTVPDARVLAGAVDATVLVTRGAATEAEEVRRAVAALDAVGAPLTGTVRIDVGGRRPTTAADDADADDDGRTGLAGALARGWRRAAASRPLASLRQ